MSLTPRLPGGVYSPIHWDSFSLKKMAMGGNTYDLTVADTGRGRRMYTLTSEGKDTIDVTLNVLVPFAHITQIEVNGKKLDVRACPVYGQALAPVTAPLAAGKSLSVVVTYRPLPVTPVRVAFKEFRPTEPKFGPSEIVLFQAGSPSPGEPKDLRTELAKNREVLAIDPTLPVDPATFRAALLTADGLNTKMLILGQGSMHNRKPTFWWDPELGEVLDAFLRRGGVLLEANSGIPSGRHLERALGKSTFEVDYASPGFALAMDSADPGLDEKFRWVDEMNVGQAGKWSAYWEGWYNMPYLEGGATIRDHFFIWGQQEQPHAAMQFTTKAVPGKDHLLRIRTAPFPKKGFTLQVADDRGVKWIDLETVWVPQPKGDKNGWVDVFMTLPARYIKDRSITFRLKAPQGSFGGIGADPERLASTGAARIWVRDNLVQPPSAATISTASASARKLGLPDKGIVGYSAGKISFTGFAAPYRILGDSNRASIIFKAVGKGLYVRSEVVVEESFPQEKLVRFVNTLLNPEARKQAIPAAEHP